MSRKKLLEFLSIASIFLLIFFIALQARAYDTYIKTGVGFILDQPESIKYTVDGQQKKDAINYESYSAHVQAGIELPRLDFGIHYSYGSGDIHDPSKLEAFIDYKIYKSNDFYISTGVGYKLMHNNYMIVDGRKDYYAGEDKPGRYSARIGAAKKSGDYEFGLWHHSQWFRGWPIDHIWEYHKTEITISYVW